jgi:hypothetical protein
MFAPSAFRERCAGKPTYRIAVNGWPTGLAATYSTPLSSLWAGERTHTGEQNIIAERLTQEIVGAGFKSSQSIGAI